jgi:uncharacterized protein YbjQ (UPF0145 family)
MIEVCKHCRTKIGDFGIGFTKSNRRFHPNKVALANKINATDYEELCEACGTDFIEATFQPLKAELESCELHVRSNVLDFPMLTLSELPRNADYTIQNLVTANVTVGTDVFNELSQGFSDFFGLTNTESGLSLKTNSGEVTARTILANKAILQGSNCILGVDIDYGTSLNNSIIVNMQGTGIRIQNIIDVFDSETASKALNLVAKIQRSLELSNVLKDA